MLDPIAEIKTKLQRNSQLRFGEGRGTIRVYPENDDGLPVSFEDYGTEIIVAFGGWHEHFTDQQKALNCFAWCLSDTARLKVYLRGGFEYQWILEYFCDGQWVEDSVTGTLPFLFWCKRRVKYFQNQVIQMDNIQPKDVSWFELL